MDWDCQFRGACFDGREMSAVLHPVPPAIQIQDLRVDYGKFVAVDDLTISVPAGEIFGMVGPNGAGKTSTFKVLATLMEPTYGEVRLAGIDIFEQPEAARRVMAYMPDLAPVPSDLKVWEFLDCFAEAHELGNAAQRRERITECLELVSLSDKNSVICKTLSRGQTQRLVLAKTLLHRPKVLILDEPASGMDPMSRRQLRLALRHLVADGAAVIVSSHILSELSEMCTSICVMNRGKLLAAGSVEDVRRVLGRTERTLTLGVLEQMDAAVEWLKGREHVAEVQMAAERIVFRFAGSARDQAQLVSDLVQDSFLIHVLEEQRSTFEEILLDVSGPNAAASPNFPLS